MLDISRNPFVCSTDEPEALKLMTGITYVPAGGTPEGTQILGDGDAMEFHKQGLGCSLSMEKSVRPHPLQAIPVNPGTKNALQNTPSGGQGSRAPPCAL